MFQIKMDRFFINTGEGEKADVLMHQTQFPKGKTPCRDSV
jgi:hypothetical protein